MKQAGVLPKNIAEIPTDRIRIDFQAGNVVFAQSWGYFWNRVENDADTKVKGKVGVTILPHDQGGKSATCIGGWQLAVSAFSKNKQEAVKFARWLSLARGVEDAGDPGLAPSGVPERVQGPGGAEGQPVVRRCAAGGREREVAAGVRAVPASVGRDPQQHERVSRGHQDHGCRR